MPKRKAEGHINPDEKVRKHVSTIKGTEQSTTKQMKSRHSVESPKKKGDEQSKSTKLCDGSVSASKRDKQGRIIFGGFEDFKPNLSPMEVLQMGSFGGTYFRPIYSSVTEQKYKDVWKELPSEWLKGLDIKKQVASSVYNADVNKYKVKCGGSLEMWESSGWIHKQDPYGWFQWYCRFYQGRRTDDDARQISRWLKCAGLKGRWRNNLIAKCVRSGCTYDNTAVSPVVRQTLQHWGYQLTKEDFDTGAKRVKM